MYSEMKEFLTAHRTLLVATALTCLPLVAAEICPFIHLSELSRRLGNGLEGVLLHPFDESAVVEDTLQDNPSVIDGLRLKVFVWVVLLNMILNLVHPPTPLVAGWTVERVGEVIG
jgi:hypothetical protein